jgi:predicted P-loop ATPase
VFQLNEFTQSLECQPTAKWWKYRMSKHVNLCDSDLIQVRYYLTETYRVEFSKEIIGEAIHLNGTRKAYHPVRQYLQSLKWDGVKRIDHWLHTYLHAPDTTYISDVGRKFLCAAVKRIMHPGCKFDYVMLLEGEQGIGKSSAMQTLARLWGADINIDPHNKDSVQAMMGSWIVELSEMAALKWADSEALKSFFSRRIDIVRVPYDKYPIPYPRQSVFVGTINREQIGYLADHTGNRRYWIVPVKGKIKVIELENDADQLWAEAFVAYNNEPLYLIGESENTQKIEALARMPDDPIRQNIHEWLQENPGKTECNITDLLQYVGISFKMATKGDLARLSRAITSFGWTRVQRPDVPGMIFRKNTINLDDL